MIRTWKFGEFNREKTKSVRPVRAAKPREFSARIGDNVAILIAPRWFDITCGHCKAFRDELNAMTPEHARAIIEPLAARLVTNMERIAGMKVKEVGFWKSAFVAAAFHGLRLTKGREGIHDYAEAVLSRAADIADEVARPANTDATDGARRAGLLPDLRNGNGGRPDLGRRDEPGLAAANDDGNATASDVRPELLRVETLTPAASPADGGAS